MFIKEDFFQRFFRGSKGISRILMKFKEWPVSLYLYLIESITRLFFFLLYVFQAIDRCLHVLFYFRRYSCDCLWLSWSLMLDEWPPLTLFFTEYIILLLFFLLSFFHYICRGFHVLFYFVVVDVNLIDCHETFSFLMLDQWPPLTLKPSIIYINVMI